MESNGAFGHFCDADADSFLSRQKLIKLHLPSELRPMTQLNSSADLLRYMELISVKKKKSSVCTHTAYILLCPTSNLFTTIYGFYIEKYMEVMLFSCCPPQSF